ARFGSTRRGIGPVYGDKYMKKAIRVGELLHPAGLKDRLYALVEWKNLLFAGYGAQIDPAEMWDWLIKFGEPVKDMICDAGSFLESELNKGKNVMLEAQLGALRDIEFGIYPYTSSSTTLATYGPVGAGIPHRKLDRVVGVMKAYSTCVGEGPFTAEWFGEEAERLREAGGEYGAATGRPRRVGPFDAVASRYGALVQGATEIALTKLDVLSYMEELPICEKYEVDGELTDAFPTGSALNRAKPVVTAMPGWKTDISICRTMESLPKEARAYISALEEAVNCPITMVSVGAGRDDIIQRRPGE
ncbi:MAG: adenylosuccinate synthetase, partial [Christensenellales bacterium]